MRTNNLTEGNILKSLMGFALPVLAALFLQAMYGAVDLLVVGRFAQVADQSGVATGSMIISAITMVAAGLAMGVTVLVGEAVGSGEGKRAARGIGNGIVVFAVLAVMLTALCGGGAEMLAGAMRAPAEAFQQTSVYIRICGLGFAFIIAYNIFGAIFRGLGDAKTPLITVALACVINIAGDLLFVAVWKMGAAGAALATVLAQAFSVLASLLMLRKRKLPFRMSRNDLRPDGYYIRRILRIGFPVALQDLLVGLSFLFIQSIVNMIGVTESAGVGVAEKVCAFLMLVGSAYMQAMSAFVAQNNGAGKPDRSSKALFYGMGTALAAGACMGALAFFGGSMLSSIFSTDAAVIAASHSYLKAYAIDCLLTAVLFCFVGYFNGCEHTLFVMAQGMIGAFLVRIPVVYWMSRTPDATLFRIGLGTPASSLVQIILCVCAYRYFRAQTLRKST